MTMTEFATRAQRFLRDESGAVTVDWIVLTAGVAFFAIFVVATFVPANNGVADRIASEISKVKVKP